MGQIIDFEIISEMEKVYLEKIEKREELVINFETDKKEELIKIYTKIHYEGVRPLSLFKMKLL
ncbi:MAG: hypothetical protein U0T83_04190 [Bacteriovoracaceae bacterium]